jgi:hypothetical protein
MGHPASLKQFAEWFRYTYPQQAAEEDEADKLAEQKAGDGSKPRNGLRSKWEKYKKEFASTQVRSSTSSNDHIFSISHLYINIETEKYVSCCSCKRCLTIIENHHGSVKNMIPRRNLPSCVPE